MVNVDGREAKNEYMRNYRAKNRERINEQARQRRQADPERYKKYIADYWERKAQKLEGCGEG